jgi:ABC-type transport system substrate-binding protein
MQLREAALPERIVLERYAAYARDAAYVDAMEFRTFASEDDMRAQFGERALDLATLSTQQQYDELVDGEQVLGGREVGTSWTSLGLRVDRPPFSDARVRRAVDLALDRRELAQQAGGGQALLAGPVALGLGGGFWTLGQDELATLYETQRPAADRRREARELLEAADARNAVVALQVSDDAALADLASLVQAQLRMAGLEVNIERLPLLRWFVNYRRGEFAATLISHPPYATPDGSMRLYHSAGVGPEGNQFGFADAAIDRLIERAWGEEDRDARREIVREAQRLMVDARPMLHLIAANAYDAAHEYVRNSGVDIPGILASYHYQQWLALPVEARPG